MSSTRTVGLIILLALGAATLACGLPGGGAINEAQQTAEALGTQLAATMTAEAAGVAGGGGGGGEVQATQPAEQPPAETTPTATSTYDAIAAQLTVPPLLTSNAAAAAAATGSLRQWAIAAQASSQYDMVNYAATQATNAPDFYPSCGDSYFAWASAGSNTVEHLELVYQTPVVPVAIFIYETNAPGSITQVEVIDEAGATQVVYSGVPLVSPECPRIFSVGITGLTVRVNRVIVRVDQAVTSQWNEIDAVELVGNP